MLSHSNQFQYAFKSDNDDFLYCWCILNKRVCKYDISDFRQTQSTQCIFTKTKNFRFIEFTRSLWELLVSKKYVQPESFICVQRFVNILFFTWHWEHSFAMKTSHYFIKIYFHFRWNIYLSSVALEKDFCVQYNPLCLYVAA